MLKATCIIAMVFGVLAVLIFGVDLSPLKLPFGQPSKWMDIGFIISGLILAYLGWSAKKELR